MTKSKADIRKIREGGKILRQILAGAAKLARPGISTWELDRYAEKEILKAGGRPSFKNYGSRENPFPAALCASVNSVVVHGIPSKKTILRAGDIVGLDIGMQYKGLYTDTAITVPVGKISADAARLLSATKRALERGIGRAKAGNRIGDIAAAVENIAKAEGLGVVRDLVGHGVGYDLHEDPQVPNYGKAGSGELLAEGMVIAIEPMFTLGAYKLKVDDDGWTVRTADGSLAAHFEHTVAVGKNGAEILT